MDEGWCFLPQAWTTEKCRTESTIGPKVKDVDDFPSVENDLSIAASLAKSCTSPSAGAQEDLVSLHKRFMFASPQRVLMRQP